MMIVKIGGGEAINLRGIVADLSALDESFVIVHGANALRDTLADTLGKSKKILTSVSGHTSVYSDSDALDVMMMAYAGLRNKRLVELCQQHGVNAVGLTGLDGRCVRGKRNTGIRVRDGGKVKIVRDLSGKPRFVNVHFLTLLLGEGYCPVLTVPILDETGAAINTENDEVVRVLAGALEADTVIQLIEAPGFLDDPENPQSLVPRLTSADLAMREEQTEGRMKRKLLALRKMLDQTNVRILIGDGRTGHPIRDVLAGKGTTVENGTIKMENVRFGT